ncbi:YhgE/Pip domain-containing protein [Cohnella endophytica]|uniref:YhgE/Pip domain-containing protein n=1 Tax=Cohnella endophytica TaxID=2419778 RepID=A0A494XGQ1_9BACL|nr:YhgE/Pip domain-containing protein [Cohnella endophytica]RKP47329.1 YhgE/Pip domain-containing protein [Cohnella endophytica]
MSGLKQFWKEISTIGRRPKLLIPMVGILMIPVMYSGMFLGAFWDPYSHLDKLPVAVVNSDQGSEHEGEALHIGNDFVAKLKEDGSFAYRFVSESEARKGLEDQTFYMAIEIPSDFSAKTETLTTEQPQQAEIVFIPNPSSNYLASQIGKNAVEKMKSELSQEVTKAYAKTVFDQIGKLADGLGQASDGASTIAQGTKDATDGAERIESNLNQLMSGSVTLKGGVAKLVSGAGELEKGAAELQKGSAPLAAGLVKLSDGSARLEQGAAAAHSGAAQLAAGLTQSAAGVAKLDDGAAALATGLEQYAKAHPELAEDDGLKQLLAASKQLAAGTGEAKQAQGQLVAGANALSEGTSGLADGLKQLGQQLGVASAGGSRLAEGASALHEGASKLGVGLSELASGFDRFVDGSGQLDQGAKRMTAGLVKLKEGTGELSGKLSDAANQTSGFNGGDSAATMFSSPVKLDVEDTGNVANYGTGFAPYFISMGLFVGALLLTVVYAVKEPIAKPSSGWSWFVGKLLTMIAVGTIQAVIADTILLLAVGLKVQSVPLLFLFSVVTSITFMAIIQFLVASMQNPGRFIAIILLIFQLTSSGGTFPLEMIPGWLQNISAWLPMTHTIAGFKAIISSGQYSFMWDNVWKLLAYFAAFALLSLVYFTMAYRKEYAVSRGASQDQALAQ